MITNNDKVILKNISYDSVLEKLNFSNNMSIICFDNHFNFDNSLYTNFLEKKFDKLIIISNQNTTTEKLKRLYISKKIRKNILEHIKKDLLIIINPNSNYIEAKNTIKELIKLKKFSIELHINLNINNGTQNIIGGILKNNSEFESDFVTSLEAINELNKEQMYTVIYNTVCNFLDLQFSKNNYCDFKNDKCFANRDGVSVHPTMGCCYSFKYSKNPLVFITDVKLCDYLNCKSCTIQCMACKLFTCKSLRKKGIYFDTHKILLLDSFFNSKQHLILQNSFFKTREEIIKKLLEKNNEPYFLYVLLQKYN